MLIFKDLLTGDELFTDAMKYVEKDGIIELDTKKITVTSCDIDESLIGGNASAEEAAESTEVNEEKGYEVVLANRLVSMPGFDKKGYLAHIKEYLKAIKGKMEENGRSAEDIATFQKQAQDHVKKILKNIKEMEVFVGESMGDGMQVLIDYREDGVTPFAMFFKEGLEEEKA